MENKKNSQNRYILSESYFLNDFFNELNEIALNFPLELLSKKKPRYRLILEKIDEIEEPTTTSTSDSKGISTGTFTDLLKLQMTFTDETD